MPLPIGAEPNQQLSKLITDPTGQISTFPFPPNIAGDVPKPIREKIYRWMLTNYIWPQISERKPYEDHWAKLLDMARATLKYTSDITGEDTRIRANLKAKLKRLDGEDGVSPTLSDRIEISDTIIFDAVDRLTNLNHFIAFKEEFPARYEIPTDMLFPYDSDVYSPISDLTRAANCWLRFNVQQQDAYRKGWMCARHHYTYGISLVESQFYQTIEATQRRQPDKSFQPILELSEIGVTFNPLSIRKVWLNPRVPIYQMNYQACPFYFEEVPRFAIVANKYSKQLAPFGYANTDALPKPQYLTSTGELQSLFDAWQQLNNVDLSLTSLLKPEFNIELLWTFFPMLPLAIDKNQVTTDNPGGFVFDEDGTQNIPLSRYHVQMFGNNLTGGSMEIVKLQRNFYPRDSVPLYGSAHMPTLDDGAYSMSIGTILENHYMQLCKSVIQFMENKDWINDPPATVMVSSPAQTHALNVKGSKIPVLSQNDIQSRPPYDATQTTPAFIKMVREQAQTSSKAVDAILGKAMGSRTSATEASNVYQTAMSGVTTDINLFSHDIYGGYAERVWEYTGLWVDPDVLQIITGSYGYAIKPEMLNFKFALKVDVGSSFIESISRQNNLKYLLQTTNPQDPSVNRAYLLKELLREWGFRNVEKIVNDQGRDQQIQFATEQACKTYLGEQVMIDPNQDHQIAMKVKTAFLADHNSVWNSDPTYVQNCPKLVQQIQMHQLYIQQQMLLQQVQMQQQMAHQLQASGQLRTPGMQGLQDQEAAEQAAGPSQAAPTPGGQAQQAGSTL